MVEIKCNRQQRAIIIRSMLDAGGCVYPQKRRECAYSPKANCQKCMMENIKWVLPDCRTDGVKRGVDK